MAVLITFVFLGAISAALALTWSSLRDAIEPVCSVWKMARKNFPAQQITITYPAEPEQADAVAVAETLRTLRPRRSQSLKVPAHRLHSFSRPRRAA